MTITSGFRTLPAPVRVVHDAAKVVFRHLEALPRSREQERLHTTVQDCLTTADGWGTSPPAPRDIDALMKRLLQVHVQVARLEYDGSVDELEGKATGSRGVPL
jgi:hypothetical protein